MIKGYLGPAFGRGMTPLTGSRGSDMLIMLTCRSIPIVTGLATSCNPLMVETAQ